jgi:hypothetical protein
MAKTKRKTSAPAAEGGIGAISEDERQRMIAEAAYFRALERGFQGGDPTRDWIEAEREINRLLPSPRQQKEELAVYQKLRRLLGERLGEVRETLTAAMLREALDKTRIKLRDAGEHAADTVDKVAATIEKEIGDTLHRLGPTWGKFSAKTAGLFEVWRDRSSQFLAHAASASGEWLREAGTRLEHPRYRTGEMTDAGTFECTACGERVELDTPAHLPPCPRCRRTEFRRAS